jgi:hypothetical protein
MRPAREQKLPSKERARRLRSLSAIAAIALYCVAVALRSEDAAITLPSAATAWKARAHLVGDQACAACHGEKVHSFHETAHAKTSSLPTAETIHGKFTDGSNKLNTVNPNMVFVMEALEKGYFLTAHMRTSATEELSRTERFDIVVGSGRKGQTYLYWNEDQLFELPVSYWTGLDAWVNSPGYTDGTAEFDRPILPRCLECHASSFESNAPPDNRFKASGLVLGISCERCHGPGSEHIARFRSAAAPKAPADTAIVNPAKLSRARQIDVCALCHAGAGQPLAPSGTFTPGDELSHFLAFAKYEPSDHIDVHASQVQLLEKSRCFQSTTTLTCITCHNVHAPQRDADSFSSVCMTCHKLESCGKFKAMGHAIDNRCVDCHMPLQQTGKIISKVEGQAVQPQVRNHQIAIYPGVILP